VRRVYHVASRILPPVKRTSGASPWVRVHMYAASAMACCAMSYGDALVEIKPTIVGSWLGFRKARYCPMSICTT